MAIKLTAGYPSKVSFKFYNEQGQVITTLTSPTATLYSPITGEVITTVSLTLNPATDSFEAVFTPSSTLNGTYYFIATGVDSYGIHRRAFLFVDIVPLSTDYLLVDYEYVSKFINDENVDYTVLQSLIITATEWVQDKLGKVIVPTTFKEIIQVNENGYIYLSKYPVIQIKKIIDVGSNTEITDYTILNKDSGILALKPIVSTRTVVLTDISFPKQVEAEYIAGYNPIPEAIYTAIGMLAGLMYDRTKYMNFDRIRMLGVEGVLSNDAIDKVLEILTPYIKVS